MNLSTALLSPVTPMAEREIQGQALRPAYARTGPNAGIRQRCIDALRSKGEHVSVIAARIGAEVKRTNIELSRLERSGFAVRVGRGVYRKVMP